MTERYLGTFFGRPTDALAGFVAYSELPAGVVFHGNGGLFLKTVARGDGEYLSFSLEDGFPLVIKPDDMVRIFAGVLEIKPRIEPKAKSGRTN